MTKVLEKYWIYCKIFVNAAMYLQYSDIKNWKKKK
jgi:hypothetical protein